MLINSVTQTDARYKMWEVFLILFGIALVWQIITSICPMEDDDGGNYI